MDPNDPRARQLAMLQQLRQDTMSAMLPQPAPAPQAAAPAPVPPAMDQSPPVAGEQHPLSDEELAHLLSQE